MVTPARVVSEYNALRDESLRIALRKIWREYNRPAVVWDFRRYFGSVSNIASTATYQTVHEAGERIIEVRAANDIVRVVSTSAEDTGQLIVCGMQRDANGDFVSVRETVTLNGQTPVTLENAYCFVNEACYNRTSAAELVGDVSIYTATGATVNAGVVTPATLVDVKMLGTADIPQNFSKKAAHLFDKDTFGLITSVGGSVRNKQDANGDFALIVQAKGGTRRALLNVSSKAGDASIENITPGILIEPQSLVQVVCASSAASVEAAAEFTVWEIIDPYSRGDYA